MSTPARFGPACTTSQYVNHERPSRLTLSENEPTSPYHTRHSGIPRARGRVVDGGHQRARGALAVWPLGGALWPLRGRLPALPDRPSGR